MYTCINTKVLRMTLSQIVQQVERGKKFTVLYRSRPVFNIVPPDEETRTITFLKLHKDSLYRAKAVGHTKRGGGALQHDDVLYGRS